MITAFNLNVQAGPAIPEPDPENGWHWDVDVGTEIYFETEFILTNFSTGDVMSMWRDIWIYNITSIENVTIDWLGMHEFSQVNATQCYYNVTEDELEPYYDESQEFALFGYNSTDPITHRIRAGTMGLPLLLPKNSSRPKLRSGSLQEGKVRPRLCSNSISGREFFAMRHASSSMCRL